MARILILVNPATLNILSTKDYLYSFGLYSEHEVSYLPETPPAWSPGGISDSLAKSDYQEIFSGFDVIVISQHLRICFDGWINQNLNAALLDFSGVKVVFLHDEYDHTEKARSWIEEQKVNLVYTVVPSEHIGKVYDPRRFIHTEFKSILTGYMPLKFTVKQNVKPIADRANLIVYRGRVSPESYGELAKQKENIGRVMDDYCNEHELAVDIQWEEAKRIYGLKWYQLLESGVCTLGTESGANIFDVDGEIKKYVDSGGKLPGPPSLNFKEENLGFKMNQVSPKLFEAIGCGTGLILYEGYYSGVFDADKHYISLKHDHSNLSDVIEKVQNVEFVQKIVDQTWKDVANNDSYSFKNFIKSFDIDINSYTPAIKNSKSNSAKSHLLVGDFDDVCSTGIGVYSELYLQTSLLKQKVVSIAREFPRLHRTYKFLTLKAPGLHRAFIGLRKIFNFKYYFSYCMNHIYHIARKIYRFIPNHFPVLGRIKRKLLKSKD